MRPCLSPLRKEKARFPPMAAIVLKWLRTKEMSRIFVHTTRRECEPYHTADRGRVGISRRVESGQWAVILPLETVHCSLSSELRVILTIRLRDKPPSD